MYSKTFREHLSFASLRSASAPGRRPAISDARAMAEAVQPPGTRCGMVGHGRFQQRWVWHFNQRILLNHWNMKWFWNLSEVFQSDNVSLRQVIFLDHHWQIDHHEFISTAAQMLSNAAIQLPPRNMSKITLTPANPWQTRVGGKKSITKVSVWVLSPSTKKTVPISRHIKK